MVPNLGVQRVTRKSEMVNGRKKQSVVTHIYIDFCETLALLINWTGILMKPPERLKVEISLQWKHDAFTACL